MSSPSPIGRAASVRAPTVRSGSRDPADESLAPHRAPTVRSGSHASAEEHLCACESNPELTLGARTRETHSLGCSLLRGVRIERGERADWLALAPLHYRSHHAGAVTNVFRMVWENQRRVQSEECRVKNGRDEDTADVSSAHLASFPLSLRPSVPSSLSFSTLHSAFCTLRYLVAVIVYSRSPLSLAARDRATGGRYRLSRCGRVATASLINQELRIISRVVVAPNWRGLGLASRLAAETMPQVGTPYVEALAAMGEMHPLFVRAGMTAYPQGPSKEGERLASALEAAGLARADRRSADRLAAALDACGPAARGLAEREIARWARSYLGAKNHRTNRPDRRRMLELVARHLDSRPVYYLKKVQEYLST